MAIVGRLFSYVIALVLMTPAAWAQPHPAVDADRGIAEQKSQLVERIIASRESGRMLDAAYRSSLQSRLMNESLTSLQRRAAGLIPQTDGAAVVEPKKLVYIPFAAPCRVFDTRFSTGGILEAGTSRDFYVAGAAPFESQGGNKDGCGVPFGPAKAINLNIVAAGAQGNGNLRGSAYGTPVPVTGSLVNYQALTPALNIANGLALPICDTSAASCDADITIFANNASTHVIGDVLGYFIEPILSFSTTLRVTGSGAITDTCTNYGSIPLQVPSTGKVVVRANVYIVVNHENPGVDYAIFNIAENNFTCDPNPPVAQLGLTGTIWTAGQLPSGIYVPSVSLHNEFSVTPGTRTYYLNGIAGNASVVQNFRAAGIEAVFYPD